MVPCRHSVFSQGGSQQKVLRAAWYLWFGWKNYFYSNSHIATCIVYKRFLGGWGPPSVIYIISNKKPPNHPACPTPLYPVATSEGAFGFTRLFALTMFGCVRKSCKAACSCNYLRMLLCTCRFCQGLGSQILSTNKLFPVGRTLPVWLTRLTKIPACFT